jgi:hypothetical protein
MMPWLQQLISGKIFQHECCNERATTMGGQPSNPSSKTEQIEVTTSVVTYELEQNHTQTSLFS